MERGEFLWRQKANFGRSNFNNFLNFLYEFVSGRVTILAFVGLFNFATLNAEFYGMILAAGVTLVLYYFISDAYKTFWTGINLEYFVSNRGIAYKWGVTTTDEVHLSFEEISKILVVRKKNRSAVVFETTSSIINGLYGFSKELYFNVLSFENVFLMDELIEVMNQVYPGRLELVEDVKDFNWQEKVPESSLYVKSVQFLGIVFLYFASSTALHLIDNNLLQGEYVTDTIVKDVGNHIETELGFTMNVKYYKNRAGELIEFELSPLYNNVTEVFYPEFAGHEGLENYYIGIYSLFKFGAFLVMLFSSCFIFYKKGRIHFEDLSVFLLLPIGFIIVAFVLFN